jgi:hypothetical protein
LYTKGYQLITEQDFDNAIYCRLVVSITENGNHLGNYCLKSHNIEAVHIVNGETYDKHCEYSVVGYASFYEPRIKQILGY